MPLSLLLLVLAQTAALDAGASPGRLRIRAVGDVMLGSSFPEGYLPPEDGVRSLEAVKPLLLDADLTFANLEGPLCDAGETKKCKKGASPGSCYAFRSPTRYGKYLSEAGIDVVSTANNHSGDFGDVCRRETEATLDALGIKWSGPPGSVATLERNGQRIALIAFHVSAATNDVNDIAAAQALVRAAQQKADLVFVSFHGGAEGLNATHVKAGAEKFFGENRGDLRAFTHAVIDAGADLVLGHGPHVARAVELYQGRLIAYSMGNFATFGRFSLGGRLAYGMVLEVELAGDGSFAAGRIYPTRQVDKGIPQPDPEARVLDEVRGLTLEDFPKTGMVVGKDGTLTARP